MPRLIDRALPGIALAVLVGAAVAAFLVPRTTTATTAPGRDEMPPAPADAFVAAWERSRTETYVVQWQFTRVTAAGERLEYSPSLAQRPPDDRVLIGSGSVDGRIDGRVLRCGTDPDGHTQCFPGPEARPYGEEVAAEIDRLRSYVVGGRPLYRVETADPGCFVLELALALPSPPYGERATFCFDGATGARIRTVIERPEATDTTEAIAVRGDVSEADFAVPPPS